MTEYYVFRATSDQNGALAKWTNEILKNVDDNNQDSPTSNEAVDEAKSKLRKQINKLKSIILQIEWSLDIYKFKKIKITFDQKTSDVSNDTDIFEVPNINTELEFQLYKYAGIYCVKFSEKELIFNFSSSNKYKKEDTFAVQILNQNAEWGLGKWIMPMAIDLNDLMTMFSIKNLKYIHHFIRTCKYYVDSYFLRHEQYHALKDKMSGIKDCNLQTNLAYTWMSLKLMGVHNVEDDLYINILVYLMYDINEARPHKIIVDSQTEEKLDKSVCKYLKTSLQYFKIFDLCTAFEKMLKKGSFKWTKECDEDSPMEFDNSKSSDEEGFLKECSKQQRKSSMYRKKQQLKKKRQRSKTPVSENFQSDEQSTQNTDKTVENQHSVNNYTNTVKTPSDISQSQGKKLRQTKLKFRLYNHSDACLSGYSIASTKTTPTKNVTKGNVNEPLTSTPIHQHHSKLITSLSNIDNISDITVNENNSQNRKTKDNINPQKRIHR